MVTKISTFGFCSSRYMFNNDISDKSIKYFNLNESVECVTFISLMSEPFKFDDALLDSTNDYVNKCAFQDLSKTFLNFLKKNEIEYLIIDTYFDTINEIIINDKNCFVTDSDCLKKTSLHYLFDDKKRISISANFEEYFALWKKSMNLFFNFMSKYCPKIKIILNCSPLTPNYYEYETIIEDENLKNFFHVNKYRNILDKYILMNFDVEVLFFDKNLLECGECFSGFHSMHYESECCPEKINQLNNIVKRNKVNDYHNECNIELRNLQRQNIILTLNHGRINEHILPNLFEKYLIARFDLKNDKFHNSIEIIENSDFNSIVNYPAWFRDELGSGVIIQSKQGNISLNIKCVNDGEFTLKLRAKDVKNLKGERIPIYIKYTDFIINGDKINNEALFVCHDEPYIYKRKVKDSELLKIDIKWSPI